MARRWQSFKRVLVGGLALCALAGAATSSLPSCYARGNASRVEADAARQRSIPLAQLPREAVDTLNLIAAGGPYPYDKDGVVFGNRERLLPPHRRGYYHEYTVPTPRAHDRGARRIVCGGPLRRTDNCYYSDDHYTSFNRIVD